MVAALQRYETPLIVKGSNRGTEWAAENEPSPGTRLSLLEDKPVERDLKGWAHLLLIHELNGTVPLALCL